MALRGGSLDGTITNVDRMMAVALTMYEDSLCKGCGLPHGKTRGDENVGRYELKDDGICHGCEALEGAQKDKNRITYPGQKVYLVEASE